ncbi:MAG TPA: hypothetical protein VFZ96_05855 [Actinomycetota bacterium]|nr:hypothetical protein [Actinomycetota bacterium]
MNLLRRVLYLEAAGLLAWAILAGLFPAWVTKTLGDQVPLVEYAWVRMSAVHAFGFAMMYVLVAVQIETRWWFSWAFVITALGIAVLGAGAAIAGLMDGRSPRLWWFLCGAAAVYAAGLVVGMAKTGLERQPD